jgi:glycosyltransferase involved in cell wall biosynthesis
MSGTQRLLDRGSTAVCIPLIEHPELFRRCLDNLVAHTDAAAPVLVIEPDDADTCVEQLLSEHDREIHHLRVTAADGAVGLANAALSACSEADVLLLAGHALVFKGWLGRMSDAGRSDSTVGTASALGNDGGLLSITGSHEPLRSDVSLDRLAAALAERSPRARPRVPTADGHSVWISRSALELVGPLETAFESLRAALIDFSQRCVLRGLVNVAVDDVLVPSVEPGHAARDGELDVGPDRDLLKRRYPYLLQALDNRVWPPLSRSLSVARRALRQLSVTIDARIVRGSFSGAHAETLELIAVLAGTEGVRVRALLDPAIGSEALAVLDRLPEVERLSAPDLGAEVDRSDIVHRPYQVTSAEDLDLLAQLGERLVITHLDLIAYHNPGYFASFDGWYQHRRVTRQALAMADRVIFLSRHAAGDAIREGLVEESRIHVLAVSANREHAAPARPEGAPQGPFLFCIGNNFRHKNRLFAIKLLAELRERGWEGQLLFAGADVGHGSSREDETAYLADHPELVPVVDELSSVNESEKSWLYANAAAVVYPTVYEGFGLVLYEAARAGTPCLFAPQASLAEVASIRAATIVPWDAKASAERALPLLRDGGERRHHIELVLGASSRQTDAESLGPRLVEIYDEAIELPIREAAAVTADARVLEAELSRWIELEEARNARRPLWSWLARLDRIGRRGRRRSGSTVPQRNA